MKETRFAVAASEPSQVVDCLRNGLGVDFQARESSYWGEYWLAEWLCDLQVFRNADPLHDPQTDPPEERFFEPAHACFPVLVNARQCSAADASVLEGLLCSDFPGTGRVVGESQS
jgi:hypothetical protein